MKLVSHPTAIWLSFHVGICWRISFFSSNVDFTLSTVNRKVIHMNMNTHKKLVCLSFAVLIAVPVLNMTAFNAAASPTDGSAAAAYNSGAGPRSNDYNLIIDQAGFDQNSRTFHMQVDNRGGSDEWVGMNVYYYK